MGLPKERELEELEIDRIESIQTTTMLRLARILKRVLETEETCSYWTQMKDYPLTQETTRYYYNQQKKENLPICGICRPVWPLSKIERKRKKDKYLDLPRELKKKIVEHESNGYTNSRWCSWYSWQRFVKKTRGLGSKRIIGDHPNYSITEMDQKAEKSPADLRRLVVTQPEKWKTISYKADMRNSQRV